ncbi:pyridoxamine 5'-phosphate oxidase family protein [Ancylobacter sp. 6x-1]|uniref:Pyridoxamine 5'-phosphate oxidase family protein n=1 Tax=Ancylobacter crimeensis TaxID=2579147 RepID=A0ABT0D7H9_9HYPH|nr:pyridoxamine 5'-phosphate oxidase family protein [Ancylobacter crimeensis]MCK0195892.1 pyridoxamine 5'-phosphate oxidase family protein [Ancylobacter crimeensis]
MSTQTSPAVASAEAFEPARTARRLMREATTGALGTLDPDGAPYVSLVQVAGFADGAPMLLISGLARHTRNLLADSRVSLLLDERGVSGDLPGEALTQARLSLTGQASPSTDEAAHARFLRRHPDAAMFAGFSDFGFWRIEPSGAHLVAGFGRIVDLAADELLTRLPGAEGALAAESSAVEHMNEDHGDAVIRYATVLLGAPAGDWRLIDVDPEGCCLMADGKVRRLDFPRRIESREDLHKIMVELARQTRSGPAVG